MFTIKLLIIAGLLIYAGYFRGWNGWSLAPLAVLFTILIIIDTNSSTGLQNVSDWILKPVETFVFWIPTVTMAVYGKEGREKLVKRTGDVWAWIQTKRQ